MYIFNEEVVLLEKENNKGINSHEKRYQWIINILLILLGFLTGVFFESERLNTQVVTNTVEIRILKDSLRDIQDKLTMLINDRRASRNL